MREGTRALQSHSIRRTSAIRTVRGEIVNLHNSGELDGASQGGLGPELRLKTKQRCSLPLHRPPLELLLDFLVSYIICSLLHSTRAPPRSLARISWLQVPANCWV